MPEMILPSGSPDFVNRSWWRINPHNFFDYASLVQHREKYSRLLTELDAASEAPLLTPCVAASLHELERELYPKKQLLPHGSRRLSILTAEPLGPIMMCIDRST
jgi:hypothetical protein